MRYSIVQFSEIRDSPDARIDAEYWRPDFIENSKLVSRDSPKIRDITRRDVSNVKSSPLGRSFEYLEISRISLSNCEYGTTRVEVGEEPDRAHHILKKNDVAVSTVRPNRNAVALIRDDGIVGSSGLSVLRATPDIAAEYLLAFCKTDYFITCLMRADKASMYPAVSNRDVLDIPLLVPGPQFGAQIAESVRNSISRMDDAQNAYSRAEALLLSSLGLAGWMPEDRLWFVRDYAEVREAERFDADYFQPKYDEIVNAVKACPGGWDALGNLANLKARNYQPEAGLEYKYIELADIGANGEITGCTAEKGRNLPTRARRQVSAGDVIVSSIEGSLESVALIHDEYDKALCSTGFHVVRSEAINPETLLVLLKSAAGQMQLEKGCRGTILTAIGKDELAKIVLPILPRETQGEIRRMAVESFRLRAESGRLLERAKRAVEIAIEESEEAAREWLTKETGETA